MILTHLDLGKENTLQSSYFKTSRRITVAKRPKKKKALRFCHKPFNSKRKTTIKAKLLLQGMLKNDFRPWIRQKNCPQSSQVLD